MDTMSLDRKDTALVVIDAIEYPQPKKGMRYVHFDLRPQQGKYWPETESRCDYDYRGERQARH
jgi:hypothetical protein